MYDKKSAEQIMVAGYDYNWPWQRAFLLLWLGMENRPVSDFGPVEETEIEIGDLSPKSTEFPGFDVFFRTL